MASASLVGQPTARDLAIRKGIVYIESVAKDPVAGVDYGTDLLWCLYTLSDMPADPEVRRITTPMAREAARRWLARHPSLPANADAGDLVLYGTALYAAAHLGFPTGRLVSQVRKRAAQIPVRDYYGFDPLHEAPSGKDRYDLWCDALITAQAGEIIGAKLGAAFSDVIRWLPSMRPYPPPLDEASFYSAFYAITHVVYTINNYSAYAVDRECLKPEFDYLRANLPQAIKLNDPETMGEFLDTLRAFGMTDRDPEIQQGVKFLLSTQNADGSWGDPKDRDIYDRYHSTWTAVDGLLDYRFQPAPACPVKR